jgi:hypothetical protein
MHQDLVAGLHLGMSMTTMVPPVHTCIEKKAVCEHNMRYFEQGLYTFALKSKL